MSELRLSEQRWFSQEKARYAFWEELHRCRPKAIEALAGEPLSSYKLWWAKLMEAAVENEQGVPLPRTAGSGTQQRSPHLLKLLRKAVGESIGADVAAPLRSEALAPTGAWQHDWNLTADWCLDVIEYQYLHWLEDPAALNKLEPVPWREPSPPLFSRSGKLDDLGVVETVAEALQGNAPLNGEVLFNDEMEGDFRDTLWREPAGIKIVDDGLDMYSGERIAEGKKRLNVLDKETYDEHCNDLKARAGRDGRREFPAQHFEWLVRVIVPSKTPLPWERQQDIDCQPNVSKFGRELARFLEAENLWNASMEKRRQLRGRRRK